MTTYFYEQFTTAFFGGFLLSSDEVIRLFLWLYLDQFINRKHRLRIRRQHYQLLILVFGHHSSRIIFRLLSKPPIFPQSEVLTLQLRLLDCKVAPWAWPQLQHFPSDLSIQGLLTLPTSLFWPAYVLSIQCILPSRRLLSKKRTFLKKLLFCRLSRPGQLKYLHNHKYNKAP